MGTAAATRTRSVARVGTATVGTTNLGDATDERGLPDEVAHGVQQANQFLDLMTETRTSQIGAVVRSVAELLAILIFFGAGIKMIGIESVAGNSVAEAFYNGMGWVSVGVAVTLIAVFLRPR